MFKKQELNERHAAIQELIKKYPIEDQGALVELLKKEYGIDTNQAVASRDLRTLGISKRARGDVLVYELAHTDAVTEILHYAVESACRNEVMIIVKTLRGTASVIGDFLDAQNDLEILGTLAGENMVFVVPRSIKNIEEVFKKVCQRLKIVDFNKEK